MSRCLITPEGIKKLREDLRYAREIERPKIVQDIEEARAHGDISENSEFDDAKERQAFCEARIQHLDSLISSAEIIDVRDVPRNGRVFFGTTVVIHDIDTDDEARWRIVGETEADVDNGKISCMSPVGRALIGKNEGDEVVIKTPGGERHWEIVEVLYLSPDDAEEDST